MQKIFSTEEVLTAITGIMVADNGFDSVRKIFNFLTEEHIFDHQLSLAGDLYANAIVGQLPWLVEVVDYSEEGDWLIPHKDDLSTEELESWLATVIEMRGAFHNLTSRPDLWEGRDPLEDFFTMVSPEKVIIVESEGDENG
jgi:hypothetical protein